MHVQHASQVTSLLDSCEEQGRRRSCLTSLVRAGIKLSFAQMRLVVCCVVSRMLVVQITTAYSKQIQCSSLARMYHIHARDCHEDGRWVHLQGVGQRGKPSCNDCASPSALSVEGSQLTCKRLSTSMHDYLRNTCSLIR